MNEVFDRLDNWIEYRTEQGKEINKLLLASKYLDVLKNSNSPDVEVTKEDEVYYRGYQVKFLIPVTTNEEEDDE